MDPLSERRVASILGACVCDAASRPLHWVYEVNKLNEYLKGNEAKPEFFPENKSPFYSLETGDNSCYFDEAFAVLKTLRDNTGYNYEAVCKQLSADTGLGSRYDLEKKSEFLNRMRSGEKPLIPMDGKWAHNNVANFVEKHAGSFKKPYGEPDSKDSDGFCAAAPIVIAFAGNENVDSLAKEVMEIMSTSPVTLAYGEVASLLLQNFISGDSEDPIRETLEQAKAIHPDVHESLSHVYSMLEVDHTTAVGEFGQSCHFPGVLQGALHAILVTKSSGMDKAVRLTIAAGGDCCSRAFMIGAFMGAKNGTKGIPKEWIEKTKMAEMVADVAFDVMNSQQPRRVIPNHHLISTSRSCVCL
jgi:hypothetical protein